MSAASQCACAQTGAAGCLPNLIAPGADAWTGGRPRAAGRARLQAAPARSGTSGAAGGGATCSWCG